MFDNPLILLASVLVASIVLLLLLTKILPAHGKALHKQWYAEQWRGIELQHADGPAGQQLAIITADKLLDRAMREKGFKGQTMGERLKYHSGSFADINSVWAAHKLRNQIAHEHTSRVPRAETTRALASFKKALQNLGAL